MGIILAGRFEFECSLLGESGHKSRAAKIYKPKDLKSWLLWENVAKRKLLKLPPLYQWLFF